MAPGSPGERRVPHNVAVDEPFDGEAYNTVPDIFKLADDMDNNVIE